MAPEAEAEAVPDPIYCLHAVSDGPTTTLMLKDGVAVSDPTAAARATVTTHYLTAAAVALLAAVLLSAVA